MKTIPLTTLALALGLATFNTTAQDVGGGPPRGDGPPPHEDGPQGGPRPGGRGFRPPISPLEEALDADHDGIISAEEIANAATALKKLDKNGDGKLTPDEFRPMRRPGGPPPGGPGGQGPRPDRGGAGPDNPPPGDSPDRPPRRPAGE